MAESRGPIQVGTNSVAEINWALARIMELLDELTGLRGPVDTYDDVVFTTPADGTIYQDAAGHYWRLTVDATGTVITTDLGTSAP